ncbi:MAG: organic hydroperoxide resistance protein [Oceanihabitans sp.]|nr:organic hydroperoxide resistance protein [Oceanihabitans sp.]
MKAIYTAEATATGGRNGHVKSNNDILDLQVRSPRAMGGVSDDYPNPEMLFAAGYSACFDSALNLLITQGVIETGETSVNAKISIGRIKNGGYGLAAELAVNIPEVSLEKAKELAEKAHQVCPFSNATRGNIEVQITVTN